MVRARLWQAAMDFSARPGAGGAKRVRLAAPSGSSLCSGRPATPHRAWRVATGTLGGHMQVFLISSMWL